MSDPRLSDYATLLVEDCVDVQPGWPIVVIGSYLGRPLLNEVVRQIARRGAYALPRGRQSCAARRYVARLS